MRVRDLGKGVVEVELRCRDTDVAHRIASRNTDTPPNGYKLMSHMVRRRGESGTRRNLSMRFLYAPQKESDRELTTEELAPLFEFDQRLARGLVPDAGQSGVAPESEPVQA